VLVGRRVRPLNAFDPSGRHAVVAWGSNAAPGRLAQKFDGVEPASITIVPGWLEGYQVVHSAHLASYGSVPATGRAAPGSRSRVFTLFLTDDQLERLHSTEVLGHNYGFYRLTGSRLALDGGWVVGGPFAYLSLRGCLTVDGRPAATGPTDGLPVMSQIDALSRVRDLTESGRPLEAFILDTIADPDLRARRIQALAPHATPAFGATDTPPEPVGPWAGR